MPKSPGMAFGKTKQSRFESGPLASESGVLLALRLKGSQPAAVPKGEGEGGKVMLTKKAAKAALTKRRRKSVRQIDNASLYAGSPMYYYCVSCGHQADVLPENHMSAPKRLCTACQEMKYKGWL